MAGNIIHAIATTNAIIAGFIVMEGLKILGKAEVSCKVGCAVVAPDLRLIQ